MPSVENRIVKMEFDNAAFQKRVQDTLSSLSQLDKALKLTGAQKGLTDINAAAKKVDLSPVNNSVQGISKGFVALSTIAVTALATITHAAITSGSQMVKALSLQPVLDGFQEYQLNIGSIQTILANTRADGTNLQQVNAALDELNDFSDKTIYNFGQMTKNIGTFTAAGVDLNTSVQSIKGISNLAAISGSTAEQASTAMYQLSQAVSTGTLKLMDWNSVVNAGMGGEVFQKALFNTGVAMHTITDAPVGTTFEEWKAKGNSFRDSLQDGWVTADVLTNTLKGFTGDITEAQLLSIGYTKQQAAEILELGKTGVEAATKIRTLSQLVSTVKETVGSGWSETFRNLFGDFNESTDLFTNVNDQITKFVKGNAEARNELLSGWKAFGGRDTLIKGLKDGFKALGEVLKPIKDAFRDIFPPTTVGRLLDMTNAFAKFTAGLRPSEATISNIKSVFKGLFSVLDIGWEVIKGGVGFIKDLVVSLTGLGSGHISEFAGDIGDFFTKLRDGLDKGADIRKFFDNLSGGIPAVIGFFKDLKDSFLGLFDGFDGFSVKSDAAGEAVDRLKSRFGGLSTLFERLIELWKPLQKFVDRVKDILDSAGEIIGNWFHELGQKLADAMDQEDFNAVLDALNVSLLGGIALIIANFLKGGLKLDVGSGFLSKVSDSFEQLTGVLKTMQTSIKADALLKIAAALALLTASVVALSLVDSAALTKGLTAMAVGFAQLMGSFAILDKMDAGITDGVTFSAIAAGMILLSTAIVIMSGAVAILGNMEWGTIVKGLTALTVILTELTAGAIILSKNSGSILLASVSLVAISTALTVLAGAVALFGQMNWDTLIKGFSSVAAGLLIIAAAMNLMPKDLAIRGVGLILIATALNILAGAVALFATMEWDTLARGFAGVGAGLLIIALAMNLMPPNMLLTAAGLVIVATSLNILAGAMKILGGMSWEEIGKGLTAIAAALLILTVAMAAMSGALPGAAAMLVVSVALAVLADVLIKLAEVPFGDLVKSIGTIAIALTVFGVAAALLSPVVPVMLGLGAAMLLLGGAFVLFGVGALAAAKALQLLSEAGPGAAAALTKLLEAVGKALPSLITGFAQGLIGFVEVIGKAAPVIAKAFGVLMLQLLDTVIKLTPKMGEVMIALIDVILQVVQERGPDIIAAGFTLLISFLSGLRDNIGEITTLALDILTAFLNSISDNIQSVIDAGTALIVSLVAGIISNEQALTDAAGDLIVAFIDGVTALGGRIISAGADSTIKLATGMTNNANRVVSAATGLITSFIDTIGANAGRVVTSGADNLIRFVAGIQQNANRVVNAGVDTVIAFLQGVAQSAVRLAAGAADVIITFLHSLADVIRSKSGEFRSAGADVASAIIDGMTGGLSSKAKAVADRAVAVAKTAMDAVKGFLGINSPSKAFMEIGSNMAEGMAVGLDQDTTATESAVNLAQRTIGAALDSLQSGPEFNPVITPVIDLTNVRNGAKAIAGFVGDGRTFTPGVSLNQANAIASTRLPDEQNVSGGSSGGSAVKFEQNIYAPKQLSTSDIYKQTRNQITVAKEELNVA